MDKGKGIREEGKGKGKEEWGREGDKGRRWRREWR